MFSETLDKSGTYYIGSKEGNNYIYKIEVEGALVKGEASPEDEGDGTVEPGGDTSGNTGGVLPEGKPKRTYVLESKKLTAFAAEKINAGKVLRAGTGDFFTLVIGEKTAVDSSSKSWSGNGVGYSSSNRITLGSAVSETAEAISFTTNTASYVRVWWVYNGGNNDQKDYDSLRDFVVKKSGETATVARSNVKTDGELDTDGKPFFTKGNPYVSTLYLADAGTYFIGSASDSTYFSKVEVYEYETIATPEAPPTPAISAPPAQATGSNDITLTVTEAIATAPSALGADWVLVTMNGKQDFSDEPVQVLKGLRTTSGTQAFTFTPPGTGYYTFTVEAVRFVPNDTTSNYGELKRTALAPTEELYFKLPLTAPATVTPSNHGSGTVMVRWTAVQEASSYDVYVKTTNAAVKVGEDVPTKTGVEKNFIILGAADGIDVGQTYYISVVAHRANPAATGPASTPASITVQTNSEAVWEFSSFGPSSSSKNTENGYEPIPGADGSKSVRVFSLGNKGKIQPTNADGMAFYYTAVPKDTYFKLTTTAHVNGWTYSNGQDGFGLMVSDTIGTHGSDNTYFFNSYMALVSNIGYRWDGVKVVDINDTSAKKVNMYLGVGAQEKVGVTKGNYQKATEAATAITARSTQATLETSCGSLVPQKELSHRFNIVAVYDKADPSKKIVGNDKLSAIADMPVETIQDFEFEIGRNATGVYVSFTDPRDGKTTTQQYYDEYYWPDREMNDDGTYKLDENGDFIFKAADYNKGQYENGILFELDEDFYYVGFFASRNADITFENYEFTTLADGGKREDAPIIYVTPNYKIVSGTISNSPSYTLSYYGNADGRLVIRDSKTGAAVYNDDVIAGERVDVPVTLSYGKNSFNWSLTPADIQTTFSKYQRLSNTQPVEGSHTVTYSAYGQKLLFVAPTVGANPAGTRNNPMSLANAVKIIAPGQTIVLMEGTYPFYSGLTIDSGINGTPTAYINMIADPEAETRPVIDFKKTGNGMTISGSYWHFYGFDVINSSDGNDGIHLCGSHNILENLHTYRNGNTGIQVSRSGDYNIRYDSKDASGEPLPDDLKYWPSYNLILNCSSWLNADGGYEDADGFAAKLTVGHGNVFDGCIAAYNADDGWDLFAKAETGQIGRVTIMNSITFKNGYYIATEGTEDKDGNPAEDKIVEAGNGNGFKMGGQNMYGAHVLINSVAFGNRAKGIDCNSGLDIQVYDSTSFNSESYNVALYTNGAEKTDYFAERVLSYKDPTWGYMAGESFSPNDQDEEQFQNKSTYYFNGGLPTNSEGETADATWFAENALPTTGDMMAAIYLQEQGTGAAVTANDYSGKVMIEGYKDNAAREEAGAIYRDENYRINMNGFLDLSATAKAGANLNKIVKYNEVTANPIVQAHANEYYSPLPDFEELEKNIPSGATSSGAAEPGAGGGGTGGGTGATTPPATTVKPEASVSGTTATSTVTDSMSSQLIQEAESKKSASVVIEPQMPADVTKADVTIPGKTLSELNEKTDASVTVKTPAGEVTLPHKALNQFGSAENVTMSVETNNGTSTIQINVDGQSVSKVDGGIKVAVPLEDGQVVVMVDENGNETILPKSVVVDGMAYAELSGSATIKVIDNTKTFNDVTGDSWFNDAIAFVSSHDLFGGVGNDSFDPNGEMNRAMLATVLWRLESKADADSTVAFPDVASDQWYSDGIKWASANGIVKGMDDGTFAPDQAITRETMAVMLYRYADAMGLDVSTSGDVAAFSDGESVSDWAKTEMAWAVGAGLLQGDANSLMPGASATRAQVATIIQRFVELIVK